MELAISGLVVLAVIRAMAAFAAWAHRRIVGGGGRPGQPGSGF
jgi:hypothetical protein